MMQAWISTLTRRLQEDARDEDGDLLVCVFQPYFRMTDGLAAFSLFQFISGTVLIMLTFTLWFRNRYHKYLEYRSFTLSCILGLAILINLVTQGLNRATFPEFRDSNFTEWEQLHSCEAETFLTYATIPLGILVQGMKLYKWWKNVKYNQKLGVYFHEKNQAAAKKLSAIASENTSTDSQLKMLRNLRQKKSSARLALIAVGGVIFVFCYCTLLAIVNCPVTGNCIYDENDSESILSLIFNAIPIVLFLIIAYSTQKASNKYPDPMNLLFEIKLGFFIPLLFVVIYAVLRLPDVFNLIDSDKPYGFTYGIITDYAMLTAFIVLAVWPVYVSYKKPGMQAGSGMNLDTLMASEPGLKLFRNHLVFEFSIDNLNFYEAALSWQKRAAGSESISEKQKLSAKTIYQRWIAPGSEFEVNLSSEVIREVKHKVSKDLILPDIFDQAIENIYVLITTDSLPRFKRSKFYKEFIGLDVVLPGENSI